MWPAVAYRLVTQLRLHRKRPGRRHFHPVTDAVAGADKVGVAARLAVDTDLAVSLPLVETARQEPIVLEILGGGEQPGRRCTDTIAEDGFVDLYLLGLRDLLMMRFERQPIRVAVVADNRPARLHRPRLEYRAPLRVTHGDVKPGASRRVAGRILVPGKIAHVDIDGEGPAGELRRRQRQRGGLLASVESSPSP